MKRIFLIAIMLALGACASAPVMQTRYELDANNQLVQRQYITADSSTACEWGSFNWCVAGGITAGVLLGIWGLDRIYNDNDSTTTTAVPSPLVPSSGFSTTTTTSEFDNTFITPGYVTVN